MNNENPSHLYGPEYDAYQMRRTAEELANLDVMPIEALAEIFKAQATLDQIIKKARAAA